jgi:uncharacterized membrane protein YkoI
LLANPRFAPAKNGNGNGPGSDNGVGNDNGDHDNGVGNDGDHTDNGVGNDDGHTDNGVGNDDGGKEDGNNDAQDGGKKGDDTPWSQDRVLKERQLGRVVSLERALRIVNTKVRGRVIDVDVVVHGGKPQYRVKVRRTDGRIRTVRLDARTGKVIGLVGS